MQLIAVNALREGQFVAREVRDGRGRILLVRGQRLNGTLIRRLHKFHIDGIYVRDGGGDEAPELLKNELRQKCAEVLSESFEKLTEVAKAKRLALDAQSIANATDGLINALMSNRNPLITLLDINSGPDRMMQHSVTSAILAITMALDMGLPQNMVHSLGTAMMFHDVGMLFLPEEILQKPRLSEPEIRLVRNHVKLGAAHLVQSNLVSNVAAMTVMRHHEYMDGSGYPDGVGGDKLSALARIACVAEVYDSLTSPRAYAPSLMPDVVISYLLANAGKLFAKEAVLALCRRVALYPTGTAVQLNTGECGVVAGTQSHLPTRPVLTLHLDHRGRPFSQRPVLDLSRDAARFVARSAINLTSLTAGQGQPLVFQKIGAEHTLG